MGKRLKKIGKDLAHSNGLVYTFLRSTVSSQTSGWTDFGVSFAMFAWAGMDPLYSAAIGAVAGGIVNCILNYKFTFQAKDCPWKAVVIKYILVWIGSLLLNSFGTEGVYWVLTKWHWLETIGFKPDGYFSAARLFVALVVSLGWNFVMQRNFVYRPVGFDRHAIAIADFFMRHHREGNERETNFTANSSGK